MILIAGIPSEPPLAAVIAALTDAHADFAVLNQREISDADLQFGIDSDGGLDGMLRIGPRQWGLSEITAVYARLMDHTRLPEFAGPDFHSALLTWLDLADAAVLNRPRAMMSNGSKPFQAQRILSHGFRTPDTLITNDPDDATSFIRHHGDNVIFKSASGVRSIVQRVGHADRDRLDAIRICPVQFQRYISGTDVRVHVIGKEVLACSVRSDAVDYRYAMKQVGSPASMDVVQLPDELAERCVSLADDLELSFAGLDLLMADDGGVVCFEVNPSPGYTYFENHTGLPIACAVARFLMAAPSAVQCAP